MVVEHAFGELGLRAGATDQEVKAAWRRLVSQWHPDRNASAHAVAKVQRINQAFEAIRRARLQDTDTEAASPPASPAAADGTASDGAADAAAAPARPIRRRLKLTLEEAAAGCIRLVRGRLTPVCGTCAGEGQLAPGGACRACRGRGTVARGSVWFGWSGGTAPCAACGGSGIARQPCADCGGSGKAAPQAYQVRVRIPAGVRDGDLLHVAARRARHNPAPADLEIQVALAPHPFLRFGTDGGLRCELPVDGFAWIAQRTVQVPTPYGPQPLALARDRLHGVLPGQGFPQAHGGERGDLAVDIVPVFPERLSTDQDILLDQLIATSAGSQPRLREWQAALRRWEKGRG